MAIGRPELVANAKPAGFATGSFPKTLPARSWGDPGILGATKPYINPGILNQPETIAVIRSVTMEDDVMAFAISYYSKTEASATCPKFVPGSSAAPPRVRAPLDPLGARFCPACLVCLDSVPRACRRSPTRNELAARDTSALTVTQTWRADTYSFPCSDGRRGWNQDNRPWRFDVTGEVRAGRVQWELSSKAVRARGRPLCPAYAVFLA